MGRREEEDVELDGTLQRESDKAKLIDFGGKEGPVWIPKSQIKDETTRGATTTYTLPHWIAMDKGLV